MADRVVLFAQTGEKFQQAASSVQDNIGDKGMGALEFFGFLTAVIVAAGGALAAFKKAGFTVPTIRMPFAISATKEEWDEIYEKMKKQYEDTIASLKVQKVEQAKEHQTSVSKFETEYNEYYKETAKLIENLRQQLVEQSERLRDQEAQCHKELSALAIQVATSTAYQKYAEDKMERMEREVQNMRELLREGGFAVSGGSGIIPKPRSKSPPSEGEANRPHYSE
jgi:regulator of replication initiation timing